MQPAVPLTKTLLTLIQEIAEESPEESVLASQAFSAMAGLSEDEAIAFVDHVRFEQKWSAVTYLCVMDGLPEARLLSKASARPDRPRLRLIHGKG